MTTGWMLSDEVAKLARKGVAQYVADAGAPSFDYCPILMWSLGGEMVLADGTRGSVPPRYELGVANRADMAAEGFAAIDDPRVGLVAFSPRDADLKSDRRLIDFDGNTIIVR